MYNGAGESYIAYADGDPMRLFCFDGTHAYADRQLWFLLDTKLRDLLASGATSIHLLDAGCGPGTWVRRLVTRARMLGFPSITARGFDVSQAQIEVARRMAKDLVGQPGVTLTFDVANLTGPLPEEDSSIDLTLCLYSVLNHLPTSTLPQIAAEIGRVTRGHFVATVRSTGSTPTAFVDTIETARHFELDHERDQFRIEFNSGRRMALKFHLFTSGELRRCFADQFEIEDLAGLDIFHSRFSPDRRWNPKHKRDPRLLNCLAELENKFQHVPGFMDYALHLLLVGRRRPA